MKQLLIIALCVSLYAKTTQQIQPQDIKQLQKKLAHLSVKKKKERFYKLVVPAVLAVDKELRLLYQQTQEDIKNKKNISALMQRYKAKTPQELLCKIKPHPPSITIAQAAMESAWGTSRFFLAANNIFGVWSRSHDPKKTIKAGEARANGKVVHLRKYDNLQDAVRDYYKNIALNSAYREFRQARCQSNDPYYIVAFLNKYSEKRDLYPVELIKIIYYNKLTKYDKR